MFFSNAHRNAARARLRGIRRLVLNPALVPCQETCEQCGGLLVSRYNAADDEVYTRMVDPDHPYCSSCEQRSLGWTKHFTVAEG